MPLTSILPNPVQAFITLDTKPEEIAIIAVQNEPPPYLHRKSWIPRKLEDFGDGGAFPEIFVAQFPLNMGKTFKDTTQSKVLPLQVDASGKIRFDAIVKQGHHKDKIIKSSYEDLLPKPIDEESESFQLPKDEQIQQATEKTRQALEKLVSGKIAAAMPVKEADRRAPAQYIRYTPSQQGVAYNSGAKQRIIRMVDMPKDPISPPRFNVNKKIPRGPPSPPAPVLHSPTRKMTVKEQQDWKIPPCISNWKNPKGYTIPLDKRLAADGRGLQEVTINENFAKLAESLYIADRKAREAVEMRAQMERKIAQKEKGKKEEHLRLLAQKAREARAGIKQTIATLATGGQHRKADGDINDLDIDKTEFMEREQIRQERHRDRQRERNMARAVGDKKGKLERERDISEKIALGIPNPGLANTLEGQFDQRLFNQSQGMDSGFGMDDSYNVYDRPWREANNITQSIYRPSKNVDKDNYGDSLDALVKTNRFVPDKEFQGTDRGAASKRDGPVQFEREQAGPNAITDDPFNLDKFLGSVKKASGAPAQPTLKRQVDPMAPQPGGQQNKVARKR